MKTTLRANNATHELSVDERVPAAEDAARALATRPGAMFLAGGTTIVDLMKIDVLTPDTVVDVRLLGLSNIDVSDHAIAVGAVERNDDWHEEAADGNCNWFQKEIRLRHNR